MKQIMVLMAFAVLFSCRQKQNTGPEKTTADTVSTVTTPEQVIDEAAADPIASIREKVERINTIGLKKEHIAFMCDEKMKVDLFYDRDSIVKIAVDYGTVGDVYAKEGYYYDKGKLIFMYEYTEGGPACEGCIEKHEYRSYIVNDAVVKYVKDTVVQHCRTCTFDASSKQYKLLHAQSESDIKSILCN